MALNKNQPVPYSIPSTLVDKDQSLGKFQDISGASTLTLDEENQEIENDAVDANITNPLVDSLSTFPVGQINS